MQITLEEQKSSQIKLTIELDDKAMESFKKETLKELQNHVKVDGFRKGHIPAEVIIKNVGEQSFLGMVMDKALNSSYQSAVLEKNLRPVDYPKLNIISQDPFKYEATVTVIPSVKWKKSPSTIKVTAQEVKITQDEIETVLNEIKKRNTKWKDSEEAAKKGNRVEIDFDGFDMQGNALAGTSSKNHPMVIGDGGFIPGFEDEIIDMKKDEEKEFEIVFPADYHSEEFKGKKVKFKIKLNKTEEAEDVEINDEFAKQITGGTRNTVKELEEEIKTELIHKKEHEEEARLESEFLKAVADNIDLDLPEVMVERETEMMLERIKRDYLAQNRGKNWEDYENQLKEAGTDMKKDLEGPAKNQILMRLGIEELQNEHNIEASEQEVQSEIDHTLSHYPVEYRGMLAERYKKDSESYSVLYHQVKLKKLVGLYVSK